MAYTQPQTSTRNGFSLAFSYDIGLVVMSVVVAMTASYAALDLAGRVATSERRGVRWWLVGGAAAMGMGIWSMHFIGMIAVKTPIQLGYNPLLTLASLLIAVVTSGFALAVVSGHRLSGPALGAGGLLMGAGVCGMHYTGMAAMQMVPPIRYDPVLVGASILIAVAASLAALWLVFTLRNVASPQAVRLKVAAAVVMGLAISGMHYTGMAAAHFAPDSLCTAAVRLDVDNSFLGQSIGVMVLGILALTILTSTYDARLTTRTAEMLRRSEVANAELREHETRIVRLNRVYAVLSGINGLIVHVRNRDELLDRACRVAVQQGQFRMAMIGLVVGDEIKPVAHSGFDDGYVEQNIRISLSGADPDGAGPTATAMREKRVRIANNIADDPVMAPWRDAALQRGYRSSVTLPLLVDQALVGCISLYASEPDFFNDEEMKLLDELARDIAFAIGSIERDKQLNFLAYFDPLTGLANRQLFTDRVNQFALAAGRRNRQMAVIMVDLTRFKSVNQAFGNAAGDQLLKAVAARIARFAGDAQLVARLGSDCFAVVVPEVDRLSDIAVLLQDRVWKSMLRPFRLGGKELRLSARIGVALFPDDGGDADSLCRNAEAALNRAKATGERCLFYSLEMSDALKERLDLENRLRRAMERDEFMVYYQPKLDCNGLICGAEALLRWNGGDLGTVSPQRFIPLLEDTGLILDVGRMVLRRAMHDCKQWRADGLPKLRVAVNVSPIQLQRADFVEEIRAAVGSAADGPPLFELEITESVLMGDIERNVEKLRAVREMGVAISIDDFGTGYSSLAYLARLPVSAIKIDRSFIAAMTANAEGMNIVSTIISLAHSMSLKVIAEGVETAEQMKFLRLLRCDEVQGYLFSPAVPAGEFAQLLNRESTLLI